MDIVRWSIAKPVSVTVGVILLVMFGLIGLTEIPIQLTPAVDRPIITVETRWPGRSPQEVVDEITKEQEERLKNVENLKSMRSVSIEGMATITLEFYVGASVPRALQEVSDALRQVPSYPAEVDEPVMRTSEGSAENAIAWIIIDVDPETLEEHPYFDVTTLFDALDKEVKPFLERIEGVAEVNIYGGREREVQVLLDPYALAQRSLTWGEVVQALRAENQNVSAGTIAEGKRDYRVRVLGQFQSPREVEDTVVAYRDGRPVYVRDVGHVEIDYQKQRGFVRSFGHPSLAMNVIRQSNANVMDIMEELNARLDDVRTEVLPNLHPTVGADLRLRQVYDETVYIKSAIRLVTQNLWVGGIIAGIVLMLFLRSFVTTGVIALAIPVSVIGTFLVLLAFGRTLNVVSLAGLAFAVGMVVDNAIVVLENIYRKLREGLSPLEAAYQGGKEVWGAILASTLTTIAVFVPVLTIQEEAGQLFRDIALAIVAAVALSLLVSITVIPAACSRWLKTPKVRTRSARYSWRELFGLTILFSRLVHRFQQFIRWAITGWRGWTVRPALIIVMTGLSLVGALALMPPMDYLPAGNRNLVFGGLLIPPGYSVEQMTSIAERIETQVKPYMDAELSDPESVEALPPIPRFNMATMQPDEPYQPVPISNFFIGAFDGGMFCGATSEVEQVVIPVGQVLTNAMMSTPDSFGGARQASIFGQGINGGNTIDIEIMGPKLDRVIAAAGMMLGKAGELYSFGNVRPDPANFNLGQQEWRVKLTEAGREMGLRPENLGVAVRGLFDGFVGDYQLEGDTIDLVVMPLGRRLEFKERLAEIPVATPTGQIVPIDTVVDITPAMAPQAIQRIEELPSVTLQINPPPGRAIEELMGEIEEQIIGPARQAGMIDRTMRVRLEGTAAKLDEVKTALFGKPDPTRTGGPLADASRIGSILIIGAGAIVALFLFVRGATGKGWGWVYAGTGLLLLTLVIGGFSYGVGTQPQLLLARIVWALLVTYLLMAALFESFVYPFVIMFSVPLAIVGGFGGLWLVHYATAKNPVLATQQLDVLTMLGFVILIGVVVNNAILLVHQALNYMRGTAEDTDLKMPPQEAVAYAVKTRVRPIFMGALTSVGGMLPLILFPGAGSEMYRGLGSVVVGGLLVSTVFTLLLVPLMLSLVLDMSAGLRDVFGMKDIATTHDGEEITGQTDSRSPEGELQPA